MHSLVAKEPFSSLDGLPGLRTRTRLPPLNLGSSIKYESSEEISLVTESTASSPSASMSPKTPGDVPLSASTDVPHPPESPNAEDGEQESRFEQTASRTRSSGSTSSPPKSKSGESREKRKRSRVTPEQLTHLERFFAADRSPTAARRKEISELLGMQERQTQIWFQNRRAKAKLLDGKKVRHLGGGDWTEGMPDTPPQLSAGYEADLHSLIHEDHPVSIIPCTDLTIGSWRRIATGKHDLVAYVCETKRCLTWFIHSAGYGFKMEIPFEIIVHTDFRNAGPGEGLASFHLSQPPNFFLEHILSPRSSSIYGASTLKTWKKCADWTEGTQASHVLRHDLIGSAVQLVHLLNDLREFRCRSGISLLSPGAYSGGTMFSSSSGSPTSVQIPQPPLAGLQAIPLSQKPAYMGHARKRSNSGPPSMVRPPYAMSIAAGVGEESIAPGITQPYSAGYVSTSFDRQPGLPTYSYGLQQQRAGQDYMVPPIQTSMEHTAQDQPPTAFGLPQRSLSSISTPYFAPSSGDGQAPSHVRSPHGVSPSPPILSPPFGSDTTLSLSGLTYFGQTEQSQTRGSPTYEQSGAYTGPSSNQREALPPPRPL